MREISLPARTAINALHKQEKVEVGEFMAILKPAGFSQFLRGGVDKAQGVLVHGASRGSVRERASAIASAVIGKGDDPFALLRLDESDLAGDPGRLADEIQSLSLLGGRRVIFVENAGATLAKAIEPFADAKSAGNLVVAEAGPLPKTSKLRQLFESGENLWSLACYEDSERDLHEIIGEELASFEVGPEVREALSTILGADRQLTRQELRKLATYCHGRQRIELADVEAICGDVAGFSSDDLVHAAFGGDISETSRLFHRLVESGTASSSLLSIALSHAARLMRFRAEMGRGKTAQTLIRGARPPIFFKHQDALLRELGLWDEEALLAGSRILSRATLDSRDCAALGDPIAERAFLSLARSALGQRRAA
jgi:DNA polymerase III subunit delta